MSTLIAVVTADVPLDDLAAFLRHVLDPDIEHTFQGPGGHPPELGDDPDGDVAGYDGAGAQ